MDKALKDTNSRGHLVEQGPVHNDEPVAGKGGTCGLCVPHNVLLSVYLCKFIYIYIRMCIC